MNPPTELVPARPSDLPAIVALLDVNKLPIARLATHLGNTIVARESDRIVGCAAVEAYPPAGLLRSVAVAAERRGEGPRDAGPSCNRLATGA
jgi:amino-acid N-acetyltransferase